jgi:hypothetical protein
MDQVYQNPVEKTLDFFKNCDNIEETQKLYFFSNLKKTKTDHMKKTIILVMFMALIRLTHADIITGTNQTPIPTWNSVNLNYFVVGLPPAPYTLRAIAIATGDSIVHVSNTLNDSTIGRKTFIISGLQSTTTYHYKYVVTTDTLIDTIIDGSFTTLPRPVRPRIDSITEIPQQGFSKVIINGYANGFSAGFVIYYYDGTIPKMTDTIYKSGNFRDTFILLTPNIRTYEYYVIETNDTSVKSFLADTLIWHDSLIVTAPVIIRTAAPTVSISDTSVTCGFFIGDFHLNPAAGDTSRMVVTYSTDGINFPDTAFVEDSLDRIITLFERKVSMIANQNYWIKIKGISKDGVQDSVIIRTHSRSGERPTALGLVEGLNTANPIIIVAGYAGCDYSQIDVTLTRDGGIVEFDSSIFVGPTMYQDTLLLPSNMPDGQYTVIVCATNTVDNVCRIWTVQKGITTGWIEHISESQIDPDTPVWIYGPSGNLISTTIWDKVNENIPFNLPCSIKDSNGMLLQRRCKH